MLGDVLPRSDLSPRSLVLFRKPSSLVEKFLVKRCVSSYVVVVTTQFLLRPLFRFKF